MNALVSLDPMLISGALAGGRSLLIVLLKVVIIFVLGLVSTMFMVWFERKVIAGMQNRIGPNKAGPFGLLQTLADGIKLIFKEDLIPDRPIRSCSAWRRSSPSSRPSSCGRSSRSAATSPTATTASSSGSATRPGCSSPTRRSASCSLLVLSSIAVYGIMLAGWSSGSKYPLLGSVRASAADGQLRGRPRAQPGGRAAARRHAVDERHRHRAGHARRLEHHRHRRRAVRDLHDRRDGRAEPPAVRPRRGRAGARRRLQHRVRRRSASPSSTSPSS